MSGGFFGRIGIADTTDAFNAEHFARLQHSLTLRTGAPVKVIAVHGGGLAAPPTVDVQFILTQLDSQGNATPHGTIFNVPVARVEGGYGAVIADPVVGDVGHAVASDRDHSSAQANGWAAGNPGSFRHHDAADLVYHPSKLNGGTPAQYLWFQNGVVTLSDSNGNVVQMKSGRLAVNPGGGQVYLGGDGSSGTYAAVSTVSGPSTNVFARTG